MIAPKVSLRFYQTMQWLGIWFHFVRMFKTYARVVPPSRIITLDGIDGGPKREYLRRWHLIPRNRWFNLYLHYFVLGDDDRAQHDHPWPSASLLLEGGYVERTSEWLPEEPLDGTTEGVQAHILCMQRLFSVQDGRRYVEGSVNFNRGLFPGQHKFDYRQYFYAGDFRKLPPEHLHMIELLGENNDEPCWSLFMTGSIVRRRGFACGGEQGWRDFEEYLKPHPTRPNATLGCD